MKKPLIVYHGPACLDGLTAAWAFWHRFKTDADYVIGQYQKEQNIDFKDRDVFLVDFCFKREKLIEVAKEATNVIVIDHHKSSLEDIKDIDKEYPNINLKYSSLEHSGARLAWDFMSKLGLVLEDRPEIVDIIEDRDMWWFKNPDTKAITAALFTYEPKFELIEDAAQNKRFLNKLKMEGEALLRSFEKDIDMIIKTTCRYMKIGGFDIPVINCPPKYVSEACNKLAQNAPFAAGYYDKLYHREFSLRSADKGEDVSKIAMTYGGGGHMRAAGFKVSRDHELAKT